MPLDKIRVLIVDDHPYVRHGLSIFLECWDDLTLVGEAENGEKAVDLVRQLHPDVVLMDLVMPVMDGITATRIIRNQFPDVKVVILTSTIDNDLIHQAMEAGANSYMIKNVSIVTMAEAIRAAVS